MSVIAVWRSTGQVYHFGVYCSDDEVIHFSARGAPSGQKKANTKIAKTTYQEFKGNATEVYDVPMDSPFSREEIIKRARSMLNERDYNIFNNNCETFARYCVTGKKKCKQLDNLIQRLPFELQVLVHLVLGYEFSFPGPQSESLVKNHDIVSGHAKLPKILGWISRDH